MITSSCVPLTLALIEMSWFLIDIFFEWDVAFHQSQNVSSAWLNFNTKKNIFSFFS